MSLNTLSRRVSCWIQRPVGRLAGLLLLVAMASAGMPIGNVHAHAGGDHDHEHSVQWSVDGPLEPANDTHASDPASGTVLHAHDVGTTVPALPMFFVLVADTTVPMTLNVRVTTPAPPSAARTPPHRPPIA